MKSHYIKSFFLLSVLINLCINTTAGTKTSKNHCGNPQRLRVIVTTDGEADDRASMVRFLLTSNEFETEAIINSSSEFHWVEGEGWNAFHDVNWIKEYIGLYSKVYNNLLLHDSNYPSPEYLLSRWRVGNINGIGEDSVRTEGAEFIARILLDESDSRPIWIQAWGGCNTISRALKIIEEDHSDKMEYVAGKLRLFLIWEQDQTYQNYIRAHWEHLQIPIIISDQFDCMAYIWNKVLPNHVKPFFEKEWMSNNIINGHGNLCSAYENKNGRFNAEGDTPAFLHSIPNGLRNMESPSFGGWGGRYVNIRNNVWMDPVPDSTYAHTDGQWGFKESWSKKLEKVSDPHQKELRTKYFKPIWRWLNTVQNDFAARADWCIKEYESANHHPVVRLKRTVYDIVARPGQKIKLDASDSFDPDGNNLSFKWWQYREAGTYSGVEFAESYDAKTVIRIPADAKNGDTIHFVCEVTDDGIPSLSRYARVIVSIRER